MSQSEQTDEAPVGSASRQAIETATAAIMKSDDVTEDDHDDDDEACRTR